MSSTPTRFIQIANAFTDNADDFTATSKGGSLRTSSYVIYVDLPKDADSMLLVHGYTGAFDKVDKKVADYLRLLEPVKAPKPPLRCVV